MISVATLMAVYSGDDPEHLDEALCSVISQQLPLGYESRIYIGVDGPISSALEAILDRHGSGLYKVLRSTTNRGLAATLNVLIKALEGEAYLFRMDADDISLPGRFAAQLRRLNEDPGIDILGTAIIEFGPELSEERVIRYADGPEEALRNAHKRVPVAHPTVCMRRAVFERVPGYPQNGTNEDVALWFQCMHAGLRFDNLSDPYLRFRVGRGFWRRRSTKKALTEYRCYIKGINDLYGPFTFRYLFPTARFLSRFAPPGIAKSLYRSRTRWLK